MRLISLYVERYGATVLSSVLTSCACAEKARQCRSNRDTAVHARAGIQEILIMNDSGELIRVRPEPAPGTAADNVRC